MLITEKSSGVEIMALKSAGEDKNINLNKWPSIIYSNAYCLACSMPAFETYDDVNYLLHDFKK